MTTEAAEAPFSEPAGEGKSPGAMLRRAREQRGLTQQDVADELHLDRRVIETIEADRFRALGAPVYARGHRRKYAQLLDVEPQVVLASYEALSEGERVATPAIATPVATQAPSDRRYSVWIALGALVLCVAALAIWKVAEVPEAAQPAARRTAPAEQAPAASPAPAAPAEAKEEPPVEAVAATEEPAAASEAPPSTEEAAPEPVESEPAAVAAVAEPVAPESAPAISEPAPAASELVELVLEFSEPSWVEVYDATGAKLMFDIGQPGAPRTLSGSAPLNVLLGKAAAVQVTVDGRRIVVPRRAGRDA
jgi:cytoskeleton protein RodZ